MTTIERWAAHSQSSSHGKDVSTEWVQLLVALDRWLAGSSSELDAKRRA